MQADIRIMKKWWIGDTFFQPQSAFIHETSKEFEMSGIDLVCACGWCRSCQKVIFCVSSLWHAIFCFLCHVSFLHQIVIDFKWSISHAIVQQIMIDLWTFHILFSKYVTWCKSMIIQWSTLLLKSFHIPILLIPVVNNLNTFACECRYA